MHSITIVLYIAFAAVLGVLMVVQGRWGYVAFNAGFIVILSTVLVRRAYKAL